MILYYGVTTYHLLCAIINKLCFYKEDEAVLYISNTHPDCNILLNRISKSGIFSEIHLFEDKGKFRQVFEQHVKQGFDGELSNNILEKVTTVLCKVTKELLPHPPSIFNEIFIAGDHYLLGTYLVKNKIPYNLFEEGSGLLSRPEVLLENVRRINPLQLQLIRHVGTVGENEYVLKKYADLKVQKEGFTCSNAVNFSVRQLLKEMEEGQINKVMGIFGTGRYTADNQNTALLLTQQYVNFGFMSLDEQRLLYSLLVDYFCAGMKLFIKPHPSDVQATYAQWFPDAEVFERFMPSELLPICMDKKFDLGLTACSTAIFGLSDNLNDIVSFTQQIENTFKSMHRYFVAVKLIEHILVESNHEIMGIGINKEQLIQLSGKNELEIEVLQNEQEIQKNVNAQPKLYLLDGLDHLSHRPRKLCKNILDMIGPEDLIIFINSQEEYIFADDNLEDIKLFLTPVVIEKKKFERSACFQRDEEVMFVYSKNLKIKDKIMGMIIDKKLKNARVNISVDMTKDADRKFLEGVLSATEAHLKEVLEENKRLRQEIEKLST